MPNKMLDTLSLHGLHLLSLGSLHLQTFAFSATGLLLPYLVLSCEQS